MSEQSHRMNCGQDPWSQSPLTDSPDGTTWVAAEQFYRSYISGPGEIAHRAIVCALSGPTALPEEPSEAALRAAFHMLYPGGGDCDPERDGPELAHVENALLAAYAAERRAAPEARS